VLQFVRHVTPGAITVHGKIPDGSILPEHTTRDGNRPGWAKQVTVTVPNSYTLNMQRLIDEHN